MKLNTYNALNHLLPGRTGGPQSRLPHYKMANCNIWSPDKENVFVSYLPSGEPDHPIHDLLAARGQFVAPRGVRSYKEGCNGRLWCYGRVKSMG